MARVRASSVALRRTWGTSPGWRRRSGEDRRLRLARRRGGLADGGLQAHPGGPQLDDRLDEAGICRVVAAVTSQARRCGRGKPYRSSQLRRVAAGTSVRRASSPMDRPSCNSVTAAAPLL